MIRGFFSFLPLLFPAVTLNVSLSPLRQSRLMFIPQPNCHEIVIIPQQKPNEPCN
jgi:hypothetical protein